MNTLRDELENIVNRGTTPVPEQPAAIKRLRARCPHFVQPAQEKHKFPYNCFAYAVGVADSDTVYKVVLDGYADDLKFGVAFVLRLIDRGILVKDGQGPIALYFDGDALKHAGVMEGSRVTSKWGAGHLWEHLGSACLLRRDRRKVQAGSPRFDRTRVRGVWRRDPRRGRRTFRGVRRGGGIRGSRPAVCCSTLDSLRGVITNGASHGH